LAVVDMAALVAFPDEGHGVSSSAGSDHSTLRP